MLTQTQKLRYEIAFYAFSTKRYLCLRLTFSKKHWSNNNNCVNNASPLLLQYKVHLSFRFKEWMENMQETLIAVFWVQLAKIRFFLCWILLVPVVGQLFWNKCLSFSSKYPFFIFRDFSNRSKKDKSPKVTWHNYVIKKRLFYRSKHICAYELLTKNHEALQKNQTQILNDDG